MARSGPELTRSLKHAHATLRDSFSLCLKDRTSIRRLTTLEKGKKDKQKLEHRASQSPCTLPIVWVYQCLAILIKENRNSFHFKVSCDMPVICKHAQVCSNSRRLVYGFSSPSPKNDYSWTKFIKDGRNSWPDVRIGFKDYSGSSCAPVGAANWLIGMMLSMLKDKRYKDKPGLTKSQQPFPQQWLQKCLLIYINANRI